MQGYLRHGTALQVFCDGGFHSASGHGAAAFVVAGIKAVGGKFEMEMLGGKGIWIEKTCSAFHAELVALEEATGFLQKLASSGTEF